MKLDNDDKLFNPTLIVFLTQCYRSVNKIGQSAGKKIHH